jgi:hypothetical protein
MASEQGRLDGVKAEVKVRLAACRVERANREVAAQPPPIYDEVFFEGLRWLDELGTGGATELEGEAIFDDEVWMSDTRGEDRT